MSPRVLCIAFHYPPFAGSSGVQRTLRFSQFLPEHGWQPVVLSVWPGAYEGTSEELLDEVPSDITIYRAVALDARRHLGIGGRYPDALALPDRWSNWILSGIITGLWAIAKHRPQIIWSTYPIASAHVIAWALHRLTALPWVADFRDPMVEFDQRKMRWAPSDERLRKARLWVERLAAGHAERLVFCTRQALEICRQRHSSGDDTRYRVLPNGYDEATFQRCEELLSATGKPETAPLTIIHSGVVYGGADRDPVPIFKAIAKLREAGSVQAGEVKVEFRGSVAEARYQSLVGELGLDDTIIFKPTCGYLESISEMLVADGLLVLQGYTSNPAIPAKVYEYLRAGRPILALVDSEGETASLLARFDDCMIVQPDSVDAVTEAMDKYIALLRTRRGSVRKRFGIDSFSRFSLTGQLAELLNEVIRGQGDVR